MRLGGMQPYFFPYLGYFQLIGAVDRFVLYDDVQWIKGGWINRNRILVGGKDLLVTVPVEKASVNSLIVDRRLADGAGEAFAKTLRQIDNAYRKAPHYLDTRLLIESCLRCGERGIADFIVNSLVLTCEFIGIDTDIVRSSAMPLSRELAGEDRIVELCTQQGASVCINPIGGEALYSRENFGSKGIDLRFLKMRSVEYSQGSESPFIPNLSIIDVLMWNGAEGVRALLAEYDIS